MASLRFSLFLLATIATQCLAQKSAPGPAPSGPGLNLTAILEKGGQFTTFMKLLDSTQVATQIANQVNTSTEGMTVFAPTDNAFQNLKPGTLNALNTQQQVQLVLNHVLPKYYSMDQFETVSNPVRTQATGQEGGVFGLNITSSGNNQVNVSCGPVATPVNNALRQQFPLAVYQVDKVLMPQFGVKDEAASPSSAPAKPKGKGSEAKAEGPAAASSDDNGKNGGYGPKSMGMGALLGVGLVTMALLS